MRSRTFQVPGSPKTSTKDSHSVNLEIVAAAMIAYYAIRESINETFMDDGYFRKSEFLDLWAECLGYKSWGEFNANSLRANSGCVNTLIITESLATSVAEIILKAGNNPSVSYEAVLGCIHDAMSSEETSLYSTSTLKEIKLDLEPQAHQPINLSLG